MGLDSVELILGWEESFGITISDGEAEQMFTTKQVVRGIYEKVKGDHPEDHGCLSLRAFLRFRKALGATGIAHSRIRLDAKVSELLPSRHRRDVLSVVSEHAGLSPLRRMPFGLQFTFGRVRDVVTDAVITQHARLRTPGYGWSLAQVREVVRLIMFTQLALRRFSDDAALVGDLKIDQ